MKHLFIAALLSFFAISCGNPHLTDSDLGLFSSTPGVTGEVDTTITITNPDGGQDLSVVTPEASINGTLNVNNPNNESLIVTYYFEKGEHFRFNGGGFPGSSGSCEQVSEPAANCTLDIEFFAVQPGVYEDTLFVIFARESTPDTKTIKRVPLRGERLADQLIPITLLPVNGGTELTFETSSTSVNGEASQNNPNSEEVIVTYEFTKGDHFRYRGGVFPGTSGTCAATQLPDANCKIDIEFFSNDPGRFTDELVATYALRSRPDSKKTVRLPLVGEKLAPLSSSIRVRTVSGGSSIHFGSATVNSSTRRDQIIVENIGQTNQSLSIRLLGGQPFAISTSCPAQLPPSRTCLIDVAYDSTQIATHTDSVRVTHAGPGSSTENIDVPLTGITLAAAQTPGQLTLSTVNSGKIDFGTVVVSQEVHRFVELENIGQTPVVINSQSFTGASFTFSGGTYPGTNGTCGQTIIGGKRCALDLSFKPQDIGTFEGSLNLVPQEGAVFKIPLIGRSTLDQGQGCYSTEELRLIAKPAGTASSFIFPYLLKVSGSSASVSYLYGTQTNGVLAALNRKIVKDAQVFVTYDVPAIKGEIIGLDIGVDITKVILDNYQDTESLCLSTGTIRKCSGRQFTLSSWLKLNNPKFWTPYKVPVTTTYEDDFSAGIAGCGSYKCFYMEKRLDAKKILKLSSSELSSLKSGPANFVFSDDTRLRTMPTLYLRVRQPVACQ
jgi:hypothetical protein